MKNNKGFSLLELIVSFTLTMVIVIILFEIIVSMKELYVNSITKTELLNKQNLFTDYIYSDIDNYGLDSVSTCGSNCINFTFSNFTSKTLEWSYVDETDKQALQTLSYGDYKINLINNAYFDENLKNDDESLIGVEITEEYGIESDYSYFYIHLPIYHSMFEKQDFGINLLHVYRAGEITTNF